MIIKTNQMKTTISNQSNIHEYIFSLDIMMLCYIIIDDGSMQWMIYQVGVYTQLQFKLIWKVNRQIHHRMAPVSIHNVISVIAGWLRACSAPGSLLVDELLHISLAWTGRFTTQSYTTILYIVYWRWWRIDQTLKSRRYSVVHSIKWKHFPHYRPFVRGIHRSPVNSHHKGQWRGDLMFSLSCAVE